ncbi:MAG: SpoIIE family protein phosphatase [Leptolyngbyaceae cyanobacterium RU_5_1]|nr:SpoIIE family protein phosphatase [Leptolyngbyaceae cyanobacterium RU_5_1]
MWNSRLYSLRTKLILAFLTVALIPLLILAFSNIQDTRSKLISSANQSLLAAASQTAGSIDTFINTNLNAVRVEAILPGLSKYLELPEGERSRRTDEAIAGTTLLSLSRKDSVNILPTPCWICAGKTSSILSRPTLEDESQRDYFQQPLKTGYPYVSAIRLSDRVPGQVNLYFSSPVRDATGKILGILRVCYNATVIQQLVTRQSDVVGPQSFAVLLDENAIRLANGKDSALTFKSVVPLDPGLLKQLQADGRLPQGTTAELSTNLPALKQGLDNATTQPVLTTQLVETGNRATAIAIAPLKNQPWSVLFTQPQAVFLAPIQSQIQSVLLLSALIASGVTIVAVITARLLTKPLIQLTAEVSQAIASDESISLITQLEQSHPETVRTKTREIWDLQRSFIRMKNSLIENWQQLETKNAENLRMATELEVTQQLQSMLLPKPSELSQIEGLDIASFMEPATEVGGDYYDVLQHNGHVKIGIGDVTGHGLESGVLMLMVQTAVKTLLESDQADPKQFLSILNRVIYDNLRRMNCNKNVTLALLDYRQGTLRLSGQHEEMLLIRCNGEVERIDTIDLGFPIGLEAEIADFIAQFEVQLCSGDGIVLYTDGLTEAENKNNVLYGLERLCQTISQNWHRTANEICQVVVEDVEQHIGKHKVYDDITLLVLKQK